MTFAFNKKKTILASALAFTMVAAFAAENNNRGDRGERRGPPPEAVEACANSTANASCTFTSPRGDEVTGTCMTPPHDADAPLACAPEGGRKGGRGPRPERN